MEEARSDTVHIELGGIRPLAIFYDQGSGYRQPNMFLDGTTYAPLFLKGRQP